MIKKEEKIQSGLQRSEWVLVGGFLILLAALLSFSRLHQHRRSTQLRVYSQEIIRPIQIQVEGAVSKPGTYEFLPGVSLSDVLKMSCPKKWADLKSLNLEQKIDSSMRFEIPMLSSVCVRVEGAVQYPFTLSLPVGSRISDLLPYVELSEGADLRFFKRRRLLKDGEELIVPMREKPGKKK